MKKLLLIIPILLLLCGCEEESRKCIKSHIETRIMFYPTANGQLRQVVMPYTVCDEYEEE